MEKQHVFKQDDLTVDAKINSWLDDTKTNLLKNLDLVDFKHKGDRETIEIMKSLVQTIKAKPVYKEDILY